MARKVARQVGFIILVLLPAILVALVFGAWKFFYLRGAVFAPYWLIEGFDRCYFQVLAACAGGGVALLILHFMPWKRWRVKAIFLPLAVALFFAAGAVALTFPLWMAQYTVHLQSVQAEGRVYHLSAYPLFDVNYAISECDSRGVFCVLVYRSGDKINPLWKDARLEYDSESRNLRLVEPGVGIIARYPVK